MVFAARRGCVILNKRKEGTSLKPYFQDEWVTIYHLTSVPNCDNISVDICREAVSCQRKQLEGIEQGNGGKMSLNYHQEHRRVTNKLTSMCESVRDLVRSTMLSRVRKSLSSLVELGHYGDTVSNLANCAEASNPRGTIRMTILETIAQAISSFFAEDVICLRMAD